MEKQERVQWRYSVGALAFVELTVYLVFMQQPLIWSIFRTAFILANFIVTAELLILQRRVDKFNAEQTDPGVGGVAV